MSDDVANQESAPSPTLDSETKLDIVHFKLHNRQPQRGDQAKTVEFSPDRGL